MWRVIRLLGVLLVLAPGRAPAADPSKAVKKLEKKGLEFTEEKFLTTVYLGWTKEAILYLEAGMSPNAADDKDWTALHHAVRHLDGELVRRLLAAGAEVDVRTDKGETPLFDHERVTPHRGENLHQTRGVFAPNLFEGEQPRLDANARGKLDGGAPSHGQRPRSGLGRRLVVRRHHLGHDFDPVGPGEPAHSR